MATILIDQLIAATLTVTNTSLYDVIILPEAEGINNSGRVISVFGASDSAWNSEIESYSLILGKDDAVLTIGGNYRNNEDLYLAVAGDNAVIPSFGYCGGCMGEDFSSQYTAPVDANYNVYHLQFNDGYASGAIRFTGSDAKLVLTAQNGAGKANFYHNAVDADNIPVEGMLKTDDGIAIRSDNYGIYSLYGMSGAPVFYATSSNVPAAPESLTDNSTIGADGKLTVTSDLAGAIESNVAALHAGYYTINDGKRVFNEDSTGISVMSTGVKANILQLDSNFRAVITALNTEDTFNAGLGNNDPNDARRQIWHYQLQGEGENQVLVEDYSVSFNGTFIAAMDKLAATENTISTAGVWAQQGLSTAEDSVWAGSIVAKTNDVSIIAAKEYMVPSDDGKVRDGGDNANAANNDISAYGVRSEGKVTIAAMGSLLKDFDGINEPEVQHGSIYVQANNNYMIAYAVGKIDDKGQGAATASLQNSVIKAAGIQAGILELGTVSSDVHITVQANDNALYAYADGNSSSTADTSGAGVQAYGISAGSVFFNDFNGNITVNADNFQFEHSGTHVGSWGYGASGIAVSGELLSYGNMGGIITVSATSDYMNMGVVFFHGASIGIKADTITINGVLDTVINNTNDGVDAYGADSIGIYTYNLNASAFTGKITADHGINVRSNGLSGENQIDLFDVAGEIYASRSAIVSAYQTKVRISGIVVGGEYAVRSEFAYDADGESGWVSQGKTDDVVEVVKGAVVQGAIDLGGGDNKVIISSDAQIDGTILAKGGWVNLFFNLESEGNDRAALSMGQKNSGDKTIMDSSTLTVNLNYAGVGEYKLLEYGYDASEYWGDGRQIAFSYLNYKEMIRLNDNGSGSMTGATEIRDSSGNVIAKISASFDVAGGKSGLTVKVEEITDIVTDLWSLDETGDYVVQEYDAEKKTLTLDWGSADVQIEAENFGLENVEMYEIEYILFDESGNALGSSIVAKVASSSNKYVINGVVNNANVQWRMRLLGGTDDSITTRWSDWYVVDNTDVEDKVTTFVEADSTFEYEGFRNTVLDANQRPNTTGVVGATATLSWSKLESGSSIRNYVIEYCNQTAQITLEEALNLGYKSLEDYIANGMTMDFTKVVSGTSVVVSNLQNQSFIYWRIQAVDVNGNKSDWIAGDTFRVWINNDTVKPFFDEENRGTGFVVGFELPPADADLTEETQLQGAIGWNAATDKESGVRHYVVELSTDGGQTYEYWKTVQAEELEVKSFGSWESADLDQDKTYRVLVNGEESLLASVQISMASGREVRTLNWIGMGDFSNCMAVVQYMDENGAWQEVATLANDNYKFKTYDYTISLDGLTGPQYNFRIQAMDYFGNVSEYLAGDSIVVDSKAPAFTSEKCEVTLDLNSNDPENVTLKPTFTWSEAEDYISDQGVRYYEVLYRVAGGSEEDWKSIAVLNPADAVDGKFSFAYNKALEAQMYDYKIVVHDYFGRTDEIVGTFGSEDMKPPVGTFDDNSFTAGVTAEFEPIYQEVIVPGTGTGTGTGTGNNNLGTGNNNLSTGNNNLGTGNNNLGTGTGTGNNTGENQEPEVQLVQVGQKLVWAKVTLDWSDSFVDESGLIYKITVSADPNCTAGDQTYEFWTDVDAGSSFTFDNSTPGCPVGIFEKMKTVYWFVEVYDGNYNRASEASNIYSFEFKTEDSNGFVKTSEKPAAPTNVRIASEYSDDINCHTDKVGIAWTTENTLMGIYSYTIELLDAKGKVVYSGSTKDLSDKQTTDLNSLVRVEANEEGSTNTMAIEDLRKFFGKTALEDGTYKVVVTSVDGAGRTSKSQAVEFVLDTTRPAAVNVTEAVAVTNKRNGVEYSTLVIKWDAVEDESDIKYYEVAYRKKVKAGENENAWQIKQVYDKTEFSFDVNPLDPDYEFRVVAIDKQDNRGVEWATDTVVTISPFEDKYKDTVQTATPVKFNSGTNRLVVADSVGRGDKADAFIVTMDDKAAAVTITANGLNAVLGSSKTIRVEIYEGDKLTKAWKTFTVKNDGRVASDLLFKADTTYTFIVTGSDSSSSLFELTLDKTDLRGDNSDDTWKLAKDNDKTVTMAAAGNSAGYTDWVGFGDEADCKIISQDNSGEYIFSLKNAAADTVLTVYEVESGKKVGSIKAGAKNVDGVSSAIWTLDKNTEYYVEVKPSNNKAYGSAYDVVIDCVKVFRNETAEAAKADDVAKPGNPALVLNGEAIEGVVGGADTVDYLKFTIDMEGEYTVKLDNTNGKAVVAALGYIDAQGNFKSLLKLTGANDSDSLVLSRKFTWKELDKYGKDFFVQITSAEGSFSDYDATLKNNSNIDGFNNADDKILTTKQAAKDTTVYTYGDLDVNAPVVNWVGMGDAEDYWKLNLDGKDGIYDIAVSGAENPLKVTLYQTVRDANGNITSYKALKSMSLAAGQKSSGMFEDMLLDASAEYYVGVAASNANSGKNSDYTLSVTGDAATKLGNVDGNEVLAGKLADDKAVAAGTANWVFNAAEFGGAYNLTLDAADVEGSVKLTVYELLTNGSKRTVKSITVKAGAVGETGYIYWADNAVKNGTGIYQVEVKGSNKNADGRYDLVIDGYEFAKYITEKDNAITAGTKDWVGMGDASDSYAFSVTAAGIYSINLSEFIGGNLNVSIVDAAGKTVKKFSTAAKTDAAMFSYDFAVGDYTIVVASADNGKSKFSEYVLTMSEARDAARADNSYKELYENESTTGVAVEGAAGWVGLGDAMDYYKLDVTASGNYEVDLSGITNDAKVTVYEVTATYADGSVKSAKAIGTVAAKAVNGSGVIGNLNLTAGKEYYVVVQAATANGSKDTEYDWKLNGMTDVTGGVATSDSVGYGDMADYYQFKAAEGAASKISLNLADGAGNAVMTLYKVENGKYKKVSTFTASAKNPAVTTGDLCLTEGCDYVIEVTAPKAAAGSVSNYDFAFESYDLAGFVTDNNDSKGTIETLQFGKKVESAVWMSGDAVDLYRIEVSADGKFSLDMAGINGKNIKLSIVDSNFKSIGGKSVTGAKNSDSLHWVTDLKTGVYYVKVESVGKDTASKYALTMTQNDKLEGFSKADDTWKQVATDTEAKSYKVGDTLSDWLGYGDAQDVFKVTLDDNGVVSFSGADVDTQDALSGKNITLSLVDANGKSVALAFDAENGLYTSKTVLAADVDYFLTVKNTKEKAMDIDYSITLA